MTRLAEAPEPKISDDLECPEPGEHRRRSSDDHLHTERRQPASAEAASVPLMHVERQLTTLGLQMPTAAEIFGPMSGVKFTSRHPAGRSPPARGLHHVKTTCPAEDLRDALEKLKSEAVTAQLDATDRATLHKLVLDELAERKIRNARPLVRAALGDLVLNSTGKDRTTAGTLTLAFADEEPATEAPNGVALLEQTSGLIRRHVVLHRAQADTVALWIGAAYVIRA